MHLQVVSKHFEDTYYIIVNTNLYTVMFHRQTSYKISFCPL